MARKRKKPGNKKRGKQGARALRSLIVMGLLAVAGFAGWTWLQDHPQHNPFAPLDLRDPVGMATVTKLVALREDIPECCAVLDRSAIAYSALPAAGEGPCARPDRTQLGNFPLTPNTPAVTCPVAAAMVLWRTQSIEPAAREIFGSELAQIEHMGVYNCRRVRGTASTAWSQHATGNAIDISAFVLEDGRRISLIDDWDGDADRKRFLRRVRDDACDLFATVLSPDYNAAHADHFHFDQSARWSGVCR